MSMEGERTEVARVMVGHASVLQIHTGNIINWNLLKKQKFHQNMTSTDELKDALDNIMQTWIGNIPLDPQNIPEPQSVIEISHEDMLAPIDPDRRDTYKLSIKLFLYDWRPELIRQSVDKVIQSLGVQNLDTLMVSFPVSTPTSFDALNLNINEPAVDLDKVKPIWNELESTVDSGHVTHIGVCDFDRLGLDQLHQWARIKPSVNQINLTNCCAVPNDLIEYSRAQSIRLLTHNDPTEILSARALQNLVSETVDEVDRSSTWSPAYIARYSVLIRNRGIVHSKGYLLAAERKATEGFSENFGFF